MSISNRQIIEALRSGILVKTIRKEYKLTKRDIRQIWNEHATADDIKILHSHSMPIKEIMESLNIKATTAKSIMSGTPKTHGGYDRELATVVLNARKAKKEARMKCIICGDRISMGKICKKESCKKKQSSQRIRSLYSGDRQVTCTRGGYLPIIAIAAVNGVDAGKKFVSRSEACELMGIAPIKLVWLTARGIVKTINSKVFHFVTGKPIKLYSKAHVLAIGNALRSIKESTNRANNSSLDACASSISNSVPSTTA